MEFFSLEEYDRFNTSHRCTIMTLNNDPSVRKYFNDFDNYIDYVIRHGEKNNVNKVYVVSKNNSIVGMIMIDYYEPRYYISYALLPGNRHEGLGTLLLSDFVEYLFASGLDIDKVYLEINARNVASIKTALNVGFEKNGMTSYCMDNYYRR